MTLPYETIFSRTRGRISDPKELSLDENDLLEIYTEYTCESSSADGIFKPDLRKSDYDLCGIPVPVSCHQEGV